MRGVVVAMAMLSLPAVALAQTAGGANGTLLDETPAAATTATNAPAQDAATTPPANASTPAGVAAAGVSVSQSGATAPRRTPHPHATPPASSAHADGGAQSGVAAPGVDVNGAPAQHAAAPGPLFEPANALERAFLNAAQHESQRAAFRRIFLDSQVALATVSADANAAPRLIRLGPAGDACLVFTSDARATQVMGANAPRLMMTGREALQRLRGAHLVILNINMDPYLTLDADSIEAFLGADAAPATPPRSAGPAQ